MTPEELKAGAVIGSGPDTTGTWIVYRPKVGGVTAGFWIKDVKGDAYILKFDPPGNPEMATSAAAMSGRILYACGYNVPQETITSFHPDKLQIKEGVTYKDFSGNKRPFTREKLDQILTLAHHNDDGTIRCLASRALPNVKGPFSFDGRRKDDPNDWCDHEHRRELRALYVICSFINHWDIKDQNTMDIFIEGDGKGYIKHHLLDFGSVMGSAGNRPTDIESGYANSFDLLDAFISLITLGLKKWQWEDAKPHLYSSVGYFESDIFHPAKWDPIYPIPAFENMTNRDAYWGAKVIMSFRDDDLQAIIDVGQLTNPEAREYLFNTLVKRRNKIGRYWFGKVNPLDRFQFNDNSSKILIDFVDLSVLYGFEEAGSSQYVFGIRYNGRDVIGRHSVSTTEIELSTDILKEMKAVFQGSAENDDPEGHLFEMDIRTIRSSKKISKPLRLWFWYHEDESRFQLVGIEHLD
jgi:hypothetical protein